MQLHSSSPEMPSALRLSAARAMVCIKGTRGSSASGGNDVSPTDDSKSTPASESLIGFLLSVLANTSRSFSSSFDALCFMTELPCDPALCGLKLGFIPRRFAGQVIVSQSSEQYILVASYICSPLKKGVTLPGLSKKNEAHYA